MIQLYKDFLGEPNSALVSAERMQGAPSSALQLQPMEGFKLIGASGWQRRLGGCPPIGEGQFGCWLRQLAHAVCCCARRLRRCCTHPMSREGRSCTTGEQFGQFPLNAKSAAACRRRACSSVLPVDRQLWRRGLVPLCLLLCFVASLMSASCLAICLQAPGH